MAWSRLPCGKHAAVGCSIRGWQTIAKPLQRHAVAASMSAHTKKKNKCLARGKGPRRYTATQTFKRGQRKSYEHAFAGSLAAFCNNGSYSFQKSLPKTLLHFLQLSRWHFRLPQLLLLSRTPTIASSAPPSCLKRLTVGLCLICDRQWCRMTYTHTHNATVFVYCFIHASCMKAM